MYDDKVCNEKSYKIENKRKLSKAKLNTTYFGTIEKMSYRKLIISYGPTTALVLICF